VNWGAGRKRASCVGEGDRNCCWLVIGDSRAMVECAVLCCLLNAGSRLVRWSKGGAAGAPGRVVSPGRGAEGRGGDAKALCLVRIAD